MKITVDMVMGLGPCSRYPRARVEALWGGRESLTPTEVSGLPIPAADIEWLFRGLVRKADRHAILFNPIGRWRDRCFCSNELADFLEGVE